MSAHYIEAYLRICEKQALDEYFIGFVIAKKKILLSLLYLLVQLFFVVS